MIAVDRLGAAQRQADAVQRDGPVAPRLFQHAPCRTTALTIAHVVLGMHFQEAQPRHCLEQRLVMRGAQTDTGPDAGPDAGLRRHSVPADGAVRLKPRAIR